MVLRIGFSLLIVFGLMWGLARLIRRPLNAHRGHGPLAILHRQQLSRGSSITVVRVADRALVLGVTDQQVSMLGETDLETFEHPHDHHHETREPALIGSTDYLTEAETPHWTDGSALSRRTWRSVIDVVRERTVRH